MFLIASAGPDAYKRKLNDLIVREGIFSRTIFLGSVFGPAKWQLLREADVFALTSYQENFGLAVAEATSVGVPVVISNRVNIHADVSRAGARIVCALDSAEVATALARILDQRRSASRWESKESRWWPSDSHGPPPSIN